MGFYEETGILILGTRLKRLSERFLSEVGKIYEKLELDFEAAWFPVFFLIHKKGPLSITEIAEKWLTFLTLRKSPKCYSFLISRGTILPCFSLFR